MKITNYNVYGNMWDITDWLKHKGYLLLCEPGLSVRFQVAG